MKMGVFGCRRNEYYDSPTKSCTDCSVICENMDIQDTRDQCIKYCPDSDYLTTPSTTTLTTTTIFQSTTAVSNAEVIAICVLLAMLVLFMGAVLFQFREKIVNFVKTLDCTGSEERSIHAQETSTAAQERSSASQESGIDSQESGIHSQATSAHALLPIDQEAFPDLPQRYRDLSTLR